MGKQKRKENEPGRKFETVPVNAYLEEKFGEEFREYVKKIRVKF